MKLIQERDIKEISALRNRLEVNLARGLLATMSTRLQPVRQLCESLIDRMLGNVSPQMLNTIISTKLRVWQNCLKRQQPLSAWDAGYGLEGLRALSPTWQAEDCSDVIRLYGEVVEKVKGFEIQALQKDTMRGSRLVAAGDRQVEVVEDVSFAPLFRNRKDKDPSPLPVYVSRHYGLNPTGITTKTLGEQDTVKKIDRMFALPEGAGISGTTADSIYAFVGNGFAGARWLHLLPIATMVAQYHHTLLECALTLTMNGIISYRIGFYTSLLPADSGAPPEVTKLLQDCEQQAANDGLVVFAWTKGGPNRKGLLLEGREEALVRFKKLAEITAEHKLAWRVMDPSNTAGPAWELWNKHIGRLPFIAQQALVDGSLLADARARYGVVGGGMPSPKVDVFKRTTR